MAVLGTEMRRTRALVTLEDHFLEALVRAEDGLAQGQDLVEPAAADGGRLPVHTTSSKVCLRSRDGKSVTRAMMSGLRWET